MLGLPEILEAKDGELGFTVWEATKPNASVESCSNVVIVHVTKGLSHI